MIRNEDERQKLYEEVWAEPMGVVAKRYALSDNGLRKRCQSLRIPIPTVGYWAKKQNNKPVVARPPLPSLTQVVHELKPSDRIAFSFDGSDKQLFDEWCSKLKVPAQVKPFDVLIEKHIVEIAARKKKVKYAFVKDLPITEQLRYERDYSKQNQIVAIAVSKSNQKRAYRFMHYFFQCIRQINGDVSVAFGEEDNTAIRIGCLVCKCFLRELTTKRRDMGMTEGLMRPVYEEVYNGLLELTIQETENHYSAKGQLFSMRYSDKKDNPLEMQIGCIFADIYDYLFLLKIAEQKRLAEQEKRHAGVLRLERERQEAINIQRRIEEQEHKQAELLAFANRHMDKWRQTAYLHRYLSELRCHAETMMPDEREKILNYCNAVEKGLVDKNSFINEILLRSDHNE